MQPVRLHLRVRTSVGVLLPAVVAGCVPSMFLRRHMGYPIGHPEYQVTTVQLGDDEAVVVFDAANPDHRELIHARPANDRSGI